VGRVGAFAMIDINEFEQRAALDVALADKVAKLLEEAIQNKGKASLAVSGGSTPKGLFKVLSEKSIDWKKVTVTLADERWVNINDEASNTKLVHEHLLQGNAKAAKFFHLKQGEDLCQDTLADLNLAAQSALLPLDVLILGMGEDGHTASLFPCSNEITDALSANNPNALMKVVPKTAPHQRITFTCNTLLESKSTFLHIVGEGKKEVLAKALADEDVKSMPIRAFLHNELITTQVFWAQ